MGPNIRAGAHYTQVLAYDFNSDGKAEVAMKTADGTRDAAGTQYRSQGNHNLSVADVDADGKDEFVFGSMTIDDNGKPLYTTGLGHGDAIHTSDLDPSRPGLETFAAHEDMGSSGNKGATFRDFRTDEVLWSIPAVKDTGRAAAGDIDPRFAGPRAGLSAATLRGTRPWVNSAPPRVN